MNIAKKLIIRGIILCVIFTVLTLIVQNNVNPHGITILIPGVFVYASMLTIIIGVFKGGYSIFKNENERNNNNYVTLISGMFFIPMLIFLVNIYLN